MPHPISPFGLIDHLAKAVGRLFPGDWLSPSPRPKGQHLSRPFPPFLHIRLGGSDSAAYRTALSQPTTFAFDSADSWGRLILASFIHSSLHSHLDDRLDDGGPPFAVSPFFASPQISYILMDFISSIFRQSGKSIPHPVCGGMDNQRRVFGNLSEAEFKSGRFPEIYGIQCSNCSRFGHPANWNGCPRVELYRKGRSKSRGGRGKGGQKGMDGEGSEADGQLKAKLHNVVINVHKADGCRSAKGTGHLGQIDQQNQAEHQSSSSQKMPNGQQQQQHLPAKNAQPDGRQQQQMPAEIAQPGGPQQQQMPAGNAQPGGPQQQQMPAGNAQPGGRQQQQPLPAGSVPNSVAVGSSGMQNVAAVGPLAVQNLVAMNAALRSALAGWGAVPHLLACPVRVADFRRKRHALRDAQEEMCGLVEELGEPLAVESTRAAFAASQRVLRAVEAEIERQQGERPQGCVPSSSAAGSVGGKAAADSKGQK